MTGRWREYLIAAALAGTLLLTLGVFMPLTIYAGNQAEFAASFGGVAGLVLPVLLLVTALLALPALFLPRPAARSYQRLLAILCVLTWLQGNLLVWDYGMLDGRQIDWLDGAWRGILDSATWVLGIVVALALSKHGRTLAIVAVATLLVQAIAAVPALTGLQSRAVQPGMADGEADRFATLSRDRNVLHIVMDGFQSDIFAEIVHDPANTDIRATLSGFRWFRNNLGVFPYTQMTVPAYLGGEVYRNHVPAKDFIDETLGAATLPSVAADAGFAIDVAAPVGLANVYARTGAAQVTPIAANLHATPGDVALSDAATLLDLALFRSVPHFAKALVHRDELWVFRGRLLPAEYLHLQYFADIAFIERLTRELSVARDEPVYKLLHVMLAHRPTTGSSDCRFEGIRPTNRDTVRAQATCGMRKIAALLRRLQALDVYDSSVIVLMADHGAWVPLENFSDGGEADAMTAAMALPLLAIKPAHAQGPLTASTAPTTVSDLPATLADLLRLPAVFPGEPAFRLDPTAERERRHFNYAYGPNPDAPGFLFPMREYRVVGDPRDARNWRAGARIPPGNRDEE